MKYVMAFKRYFASSKNIHSLAIWCAALLASVVSVEYARAFRIVEERYQDLISKNESLIFLLSPLCFALAGWLVQRFSPPAGGSGIPQILAAHELPEKKAAEFVSLRVAAVKIVSSLITVAGGGAIGREGPTLQVSACIFHFVGDKLRARWPGMSHQTWLVTGAAAGLAAAFNTPLGGIVYAIEEFSSNQFHKTKIAVMSSVIIAGLVSQWLMGPYLYLGLPRMNPFNLSILPYAILIGLVGGWAGGLFGHVLETVMLKQRRLAKRRKAMMAVLCGLVMAGLIFWNRGAAGSGIRLIHEILFNGALASPGDVAVRIAAPLLTYITGVAGGIFAPSLSAGAAIGSLLDTLLDTGAPNLMILMGMISFLTGVTRTPFTAFILVLEMTDRHSAIFPMMCAALVSFQGARMISTRGFYETMKD